MNPNDPSTYPALMTPDEAASLMHTSAWMVRDLCRRGEVPCVKAGRRWLIQRDRLLGVA